MPCVPATRPLLCWRSIARAAPCLPLQAPGQAPNPAPARCPGCTHRRAQAHTNLSTVSLLLGRRGEAVGAARAAVKLAPAYTPALLALATAHMARKDWNKARRRLRQALDAAPGHCGERLWLLLSTGCAARAVWRWPRALQSGANGCCSPLLGLPALPCIALLALSPRSKSDHSPLAPPCSLPHAAVAQQQLWACEGKIARRNGKIARAAGAVTLVLLFGMLGGVCAIALLASGDDKKQHETVRPAPAGWHGAAAKPATA